MHSEYGHADVNIHNSGNSHTDKLFAGLGDSMHGMLAWKPAWMDCLWPSGKYSN